MYVFAVYFTVCSLRIISRYRVGCIFVPLLIFLNKASAVVSVVLGGFIAYQLAVFTWYLFPEQEFQYQWIAPKAQASSTGNKIDTQKLQQQHLFGMPVASKKVQQKKAPLTAAPKTKLNLTLVGLVAASEPRFSSAIISYQKKQDSYFVDSKITNTEATVSEIREDRVILDVGGELQTLMLDGVETLNHLHKASKIVEKTFNKKVIKNKVKRIELDRKAILKNPGQLMTYIRISPYRRDGKVAGYRVSPGKDRTLFDKAGLKSGDLAIELNGIDLTNTQQAFSLMKVFPTMTEMALTVERGGQLHELYLNIP